MRYLYFAYGSNLYVEQMKSRCPDAVEIASATLPGWKLEECLYANITKSKNNFVPGAIYSISEDDLTNLDEYEGYPDFYTRKVVEVIDKDNNICQAIVYVMTSNYKKSLKGQKYSDYYRAICSAGANYWGIDNNFLIL
jgi:gamma-glutamylcyclotransferase (GGCT)/AIG2-like uncharacterized protein YtfP